MHKLFNNIFDNKRVLVTGHTGFKGSWLTFWLQKLGATVLGYSNNLPTNPNHYELLRLDFESVMGDIRDLKKLQTSVTTFQPDIIFHMAAQPLVWYSYRNPVETFEVNVIGTVNIFEAARNCKGVKALVNITSDKCYENHEKDIAYTEDDRMGGYDPYSASKGCAELVVNSYRNSYFKKSQESLLLASARAGNVIGGGDWAEDRLIPDIIRASENNTPVAIRNPYATRPWQHVLEPLSGYLLLGQYLLEGNSAVADGWNFGPLNNETLTVQEVLTEMKNVWNGLQYNITPNAANPHEASLLRLDCSKANNNLKWFPVWDMQKAILKTAEWYKQFYSHNDVMTGQQLDEYINDAIQKKLGWTI